MRIKFTLIAPGLSNGRVFWVCSWVTVLHPKNDGPLIDPEESRAWDMDKCQADRVMAVKHRYEPDWRIELVS